MAAQPDNFGPVDEALLLAAQAGLLAERLDMPLVPWQQRVLDQAMLHCTLPSDGD